MSSLGSLSHRAGVGGGDGGWGWEGGDWIMIDADCQESTRLYIYPHFGMGTERRAIIYQGLCDRFQLPQTERLYSAGFHHLLAVIILRPGGYSVVLSRPRNKRLTDQHGIEN